MYRKGLTIALGLILLFGSYSFTQTLDEIIKKNIEARGGYEKLKAVKSMKATGKQLMRGIEIPFTMQNKRPNYLRIEVTVQEQTVVQAYDGEKAWMINPLTGSTDPQTMPEEQAKRIIEQADIDGHLVDYEQKGHKVELIGKEDMEGTEVYKLKVTLKNGDIRYDYLDAEYFLELKITAKVQRQESEYEVETFLSDYKEVNGLMMAHSIESKMGGNTVSQITIENIELDVEMDDSIFKMPEKSEKEETPKQ